MRTALFLTLGLLISMPAAANEDARQSLLQAERAFSARSAEIGFADAMAEVLDDNGVILENKRPPIVGKAEVLRTRREGWPPPEAKAVLTWEPQAASVSDDGTMGFTYGPYAFSFVDKDGNPRVNRGLYTSFWGRKPGGPWRLLLDTGTQGLE